MSTPPKSSAVRAVLRGGPADLPADLREIRTSPPDRTLKIPHRGGYEHFELADEGADGVQVFGWTMRTKIAE
jgi:hypothetical protein